MLHFLAMAIVMCLLAPGAALAEAQGIDFFGERISPVVPDECSECTIEPAYLNPELDKKTREIQKALQDKFSQTESQLNEVVLFIDLDSRLWETAVSRLVRFKRDWPDWSVRGVIQTKGTNLKQRLLRKQGYFGNDIEFSVDLNGSLARQFGVTKSPCYVITNQRMRYQVEVQTDLSEFVLSLEQ